MEAGKIYNNSFGKDAKFYSFYQTLKTYEKTINDKTVILIPIDSPFAKHLIGMK